MHKLILVFYIPRFTQTRVAQRLTNIEGKVCGWWQWRVGGQIWYIAAVVASVMHKKVGAILVDVVRNVEFVLPDGY